MSLEALKQKALQNEMVRTEYEKLAGEFDLMNQASLEWAAVRESAVERVV